jgi:hypothetical protein
MPCSIILVVHNRSVLIVIHKNIFINHFWWYSKFMGRYLESNISGPLTTH